jgi:hypothetical protein
MQNRCRSRVITRREGTDAEPQRSTLGADMDACVRNGDRHGRMFHRGRKPHDPGKYLYGSTPADRVRGPELCDERTCDVDELHRLE